MKFSNVQSVLLGIGYSQFILKNPEHTSHTAEKVFKICENESLEHLEADFKAVVASPRMATPAQEKFR